MCLQCFLNFYFFKSSYWLCPVFLSGRFFLGRIGDRGSLDEVGEGVWLM